MRKRWKRIIWASSILLGLLLIGVLVVSWKSGKALLHPEREQVANTPTGLGLEWEWANFTTDDGVPLVGWWMPANGSANETVVFLHGYGDSKNQSLEVAPALHAAGFNVLAFDFRAHGYSGGAYTTAGLVETRDVRAALDWLEARPEMGPDPPIALMGWSMGAAIALRSAPLFPEVDAVIADSAFSKMQHIVDSSISHFTGLPRWPFGPLAVTFAGWSIGKDISDNQPVRDIGNIHRPILLIQGLGDTVVTPGQVDELARAAGEGVAVFKVAGATHVEAHLTAPEEYDSRVTDFLDTAFPNR